MDNTFSEAEVKPLEEIFVKTAGQVYSCVPDPEIRKHFLSLKQIINLPKPVDVLADQYLPSIPKHLAAGKLEYARCEVCTRQPGRGYVFSSKADTHRCL